MWMNRKVARIAGTLVLLGAGGAAAAPGDFLWNRGWDASGLADMDEDGATGAAGMFFGAINFGGGVQNSANPFTGDVWVARYGPAGAFQWSRTFTPTQMGVTVTAVTCAPNGAVYVAGTIIAGAMIDFGGGNLSGADQMWIVKFDELGNHLWSDTFGVGTVRSLDGDQNLLAAGGDFQGPIDFGGGAINPAGGLDAFVALLHGGAAHIWSAGFGDASDQGTKDVDVDVSGTLVATGAFAGGIDFGGGALVSNAIPDLFLAKFDPAGTHLWSKNYPGNFGAGPDVRVSVAQDAGAERVALAATSMNVAVDFGGGALAPLGGSDVVVALFDELGAHQWSRRFGSAVDDQAQDLAFDLGNNVIATGAFQAAIDFGATSGPLVSNGGIDLFISSWSAGGVHAWNRRYGTMNDDVLCRVATDPLGNALLFGSADNGIDFGGGALADAGIYLAKIRALNAPVDAPVVAIDEDVPAVAFPNPFTSATRIRFEVPTVRTLTVSIHDVAGRRVRVLAQGSFAAGTASLAWDGRDEAGRSAPGGVYFWRVAGGGGTATGRVVRIP